MENGGFRENMYSMTKPKLRGFTDTCKDEVISAL